jgi:mannosyl-3-phosphoglycerate phosphatase
LPSTHIVVFCATDDLIPLSGKPLSGFAEFLTSLADAGMPCVWLTSRSRHQLDALWRRHGNGAPFIGEGGSCVYLAEDYFHLKPPHTVRLGRFIAIPVAKPLPAAVEALELVSEQSSVEVVPLRSLSPRELMQNTGLPRTESEAIRQRDFDELFFFAGASEKDVQRFLHQAAHLKFSVRPHGMLWSLAVNSGVAACVRELRKLYDRTFHRPAFLVGLATPTESAELFPACDRAILLTDRSSSAIIGKSKSGAAAKTLPLFQPDTWEVVLEAIANRQF